MVLSLWEEGLVINGERHKARSEHFLRVIEEHVQTRGGWGAIEPLTVNTRSASFTASRGLTVLINTLARAYGIPVCVFDGDDASRATSATLPLDPDYDGEPHIG